MATQFSQTAQNWLGNKQTSAPSSSSGFSSYTPTANAWLMQKPASQPQTVIKPIAQSKPVATPAPSFLQNIYSSFQSFVNKAISAGKGEGLQNGELVPRDTSIKSPIPQKQMLPQAKKANTHTNLDTVAEFAAGVANTPAEAYKGTKSLATHIQQGNSTPQQTAGDLGAIATALLMGYTDGGFGLVKPGLEAVAKTAGKGAIVQVGKAIGKDAIVGGLFGGLGGLQSGRDITNVKDYVTNLWNNVKTGVEFGAGAGAVVHGTHVVAKNVILPLSKTATTKDGAIFVKNVDTKPEIVHMQFDPKVAQGVAVANEDMANSTAGKAIVKESIAATDQNAQVGVTPHDDGKYALPGGQKVDVSTVPEVQPKEEAKPVENSRVIPEKSPKVATEVTTTDEKGNVTSKQFDAKGNEIVPTNKKVLTGNEVKAIRDVIVSKMNHIRETSKTEQVYMKNLDETVKDITDRAQGDKQVLSALRTELSSEMYGMVGKSGNYKEDFKNLQEMMKDTSGTGEILNKLDDHVKNLDEKLLSTPDKEYTKPAFIKERAQKQTGVATTQLPVGEGKVKNSRALERLKEHLQDKSPEDYAKMNETEAKYHQMNIKDQAEKALELVEKDPQRAYRVAKGYENPPEGLLPHSVQMALADHALAEKNYELAADVHKSGSLYATRAGQEIVMERGRYADNSPHAFMRQLIKIRLERLGNMTDKVNINVKGHDIVDTAKSASKRAMNKIDQATDKLQAQLKKQQSKIQSAQSLLDQLTCK